MTGGVIEIREPRPIIMIGTPYYANVAGKFALSLAQTVYDLYPKYRVALATAESSQVHINRNIIVRTAYEQKADYLIFIDSDMVWLTTYIEKLIKSGKDVIGGLCTTRKVRKTKDGSPYTPLCVYESDGAGRCRPIAEIPKVPFRCFAIGAGFLLLTKSIVRRLWDDRYKNGYPFDLIAHGLSSDKMTVESIYLGEDISFSWRLRKMGVDIWCEPSVRPGHVGESVYGVTDEVDEIEAEATRVT